MFSFLKIIEQIKIKTKQLEKSRKIEKTQKYAQN